MSKPSLEPLNTAVSDALFFLRNTKGYLRGDVDGKDLEEARGELANASNAIDDAMGEIDKLLAPPCTREESYDA